MTTEYDQRFFMALAHLVAKRSDCPDKVGACIVNERNQIVGIGCNMAHPYNNMRIHAEQNAFENASLRIDNCIMFITRHPCMKCVDLIIKHGIKKIIYDQWSNIYIEASKKLIAANVMRQRYVFCIHPLNPFQILAEF